MGSCAKGSCPIQTLIFRHDALYARSHPTAGAWAACGQSYILNATFTGRRLPKYLIFKRQANGEGKRFVLWDTS